MTASVMRGTVMAALLLTTAPVAAACAAPGPTKLFLQGNGTVEAPPDQVTALFTAQAGSAQPADAQGKTNALVQHAMSLAKDTSSVTIAAESYSVSEDHPDNGPHVWTARQSLRLTAGSGEALLPLVTRLQAAGLLLDGLVWSLSPGKRQALSLEAEKRAIADMRKHAASAADALGMKIAGIEEVRVSGGSMSRPMVMATMARMAPVASTPETQSVSASVDATIQLMP